MQEKGRNKWNNRVIEINHYNREKKKREREKEFFIVFAFIKKLYITLKKSERKERRERKKKKRKKNERNREMKYWLSIT